MEEIISNSPQSEKYKINSRVTIVAIIFWGIGFLINSADYFLEGHTFLFDINLVVLVSLLVGLLTLWRNKKLWCNIFIFEYIVITLNTVLTMYYWLHLDQSSEIKVLGEMCIGFVIVATSAYALKPRWILIWAFTLVSCFIGFAFYFDNKILQELSIVISYVVLGMASFTFLYINMYKKRLNDIRMYKKEAKRITEIINSEDIKLNNSIQSFVTMAEEAKITLTPEMVEELINIKQCFNVSYSNYTQDVNNEKTVFINRLLLAHPNLTNNELELSYKIIKGFDNKEIANSMSYTSDTVKVYRSKIRKKLKLKREDNLVQYLRKFSINNIRSL